MITKICSNRLHTQRYSVAVSCDVLNRRPPTSPLQSPGSILYPFWNGFHNALVTVIIPNSLLMPISVSVLPNCAVISNSGSYWCQIRLESIPLMCRSANVFSPHVAVGPLDLYNYT